MSEYVRIICVVVAVFALLCAVALMATARWGTDPGGRVWVCPAWQSDMECGA